MIRNILSIEPPHDWNPEEQLERLQEKISVNFLVIF